LSLILPTPLIPVKSLVEAGKRVRSDDDLAGLLACPGPPTRATVRPGYRNRATALGTPPHLLKALD
jgi:hypothetical protein